MLRQLTDIGHPRYLGMDGQCQPSVSPHPPDGHEPQPSSAAPAFRVTRYLSRTKREYVKHSHAAVVTDVGTGTKIQRYGLMLRDES